MQKSIPYITIQFGMMGHCDTGKQERTLALRYLGRLSPITFYSWAVADFKLFVSRADKQEAFVEE